MNEEQLTSRFTIADAERILKTDDLGLVAELRTDLFLRKREVEGSKTITRTERLSALRVLEPWLVRVKARFEYDTRRTLESDIAELREQNKEILRLLRALLAKNGSVVVRKKDGQQ